MTVSKSQMGALLRFLAGCYPSFKPNAYTTDAWMVVLGPLEYQQVFDAVHELASRGSQWAPSPGDVASRVKSYTPPTSSSQVPMIEESKAGFDTEFDQLLERARNGDELTYVERKTLYKEVVPQHLRTGRYPPDTEAGRRQSQKEAAEWDGILKRYGWLWHEGVL